jgi:hypothetical protein
MVKEGVDYKLLCKQLQGKVDKQLSDNERLKKTTREADDRAKVGLHKLNPV